MGLFTKLNALIDNWVADYKEKKQLYKQAYKEEELKELKKKAKRDCKAKYKPSTIVNNNKGDDFSKNFSPEELNKKIFGGNNGGF